MLNISVSFLNTSSKFV